MVLNEKIKNKLETLSLPQWWREGDTLRIGYAAGLDPKKTLKVRFYKFGDYFNNF